MFYYIPYRRFHGLLNYGCDKAQTQTLLFKFQIVFSLLFHIASLFVSYVPSETVTSLRADTQYICGLNLCLKDLNRKRLNEELLLSPDYNFFIYKHFILLITYNKI